MLHPSYNELMKAVNENAGGTDENPVVSSRYSIVIAAAKRARQLITEENLAIEAEGEDAKEGRPEKMGKAEKPLSTAIRELMEGDVKVVPNEDDIDDDSDLLFGSSTSLSDVLYEGDEEDDMESDDVSDEDYEQDLTDEDLEDDDDAAADDDEDMPLDLTDDELRLD